MYILYGTLLGFSIIIVSIIIINNECMENKKSIINFKKYPEML